MVKGFASIYFKKGGSV